MLTVVCESIWRDYVSALGHIVNIGSGQIPVYTETARIDLDLDRTRDFFFCMVQYYIHTETDCKH